MGRPVTILFFATARRAVGRAFLSWAVGSDGIPAEDLLRALAEAYPKLAPTLRVSRYVRNGRYLDDLGDRIRPGDEFAVHPPYGGG